jgi:choline dehydrogenase
MWTMWKRVNGVVCLRGHAQDFDLWEEAGAQGWAHAVVLPCCKRMETWHSGGHGGDAAWRGTDGPMHVSRGPRENPLFKTFAQAGVQAGYEATEDCNGEKQEGFGPMEQTVHDQRRWLAANASFT